MVQDVAVRAVLILVVPCDDLEGVGGPSARKKSVPEAFKVARLAVALDVVPRSPAAAKVNDPNEGGAGGVVTSAGSEGSDRFPVGSTATTE